MEKIQVIDITIRDIFQSVEPKFINKKILNRIIEQLCKIQFDFFEVLGGSSFEKMIESSTGLTPFEIIYEIKNKNPQLRLQALIGAKNLVGLEVYPNNVIKKFIKKCCQNGIEKFKVYDSLNDIENFKYTVSEIIENGAKCQGTLIYDDLEPNEFYISQIDKLLSIGCSSICIKDVESTLTPVNAYRLFKDLTSYFSNEFYLSAYNLRGMQVINYYNACMGGASGIDISFIPSSYNDLSPTIFPFLLSIKNTDYYTEIEYAKLLEVFQWIKTNLYPLIKNELLYSRFIYSNKNQNLLPKWLLSNINKQLEEIGESSKIDIVLDEVLKIKNEIGNPSLATPIGQIIGSQAILNTIISDKRWEITNDEIKKLISGYYGKLPREINSQILQEQLFSTQVQFETQNNIFEQCKEELKDLSEKDEDILCYVFFPEKTLKFLKRKRYEYAADIIDNKKQFFFQHEQQEMPVPSFLDNSKAAKLKDIDLQKLRDITNLVETSNIDEIKLEIDGIKIEINKKSLQQKSYSVKEKQDKSIKSKNILDKDLGYEKENTLNSPKTEYEFEDINKDKKIVEIKSPIVGVFYSSPSPGAEPFVVVGSKVKKGDTLCIIEAMKLMNKINSDYDGTISEILVKNEDAVEYDQTLMKIIIE